MKDKFWIIVQTSRRIELHGPHETRTEANIKSRAYADNVEVTNFMILNQEQLVTLLELMTDTLED